MQFNFCLDFHDLVSLSNTKEPEPFLHRSLFAYTCHRASSVLAATDRTRYCTVVAAIDFHVNESHVLQGQCRLCV
jgi:hypothetical protein